MNKFSSLEYLRQQHSSRYTQSWIYAGITAWFSQQDQFAELEFSDKIDTLFVPDWNTNFKDTNTADKKYFGLIHEGSPEYWFDLDNWHNTTLITGHENLTQWHNSNISIGFDRWDFHMHKVCSDPRISQEINKQSVKNAKFDLLVLQGVPRPHRVKWLSSLQERSTDLKVLTDDTQTELITNYRTTTLGYEQYFNKLNCQKFLNHTMFPSFYDDADTVSSSFLPHRKLFNDCLVNVILETTAYYTDSPFLTEKTFKVLINARPFVILGDTNCLAKLKQEGFKTFDKFCDESYDTEIDLDKRIEKTLDSTIQLIDACRRYPTEIDEICQHNQRLFFDRTRLEHKLAKFGKLCLTYLYNVETE